MIVVPGSVRLKRTIRIATRASKLALWQAEFVRDQLKSLYPEMGVELVTLTSSGDVVLDRPLYAVGGVGIFTKEIQEAVLDGRADIAVHSLKDLPTVSHPSLCLAAVPTRGAVGDAFLSPKHSNFDSLPPGARIATSSLRRQAQLLRRRPDLKIESVRGNVETRIRKMYEEGFDGMILAVAGVERLGLTNEVREILAESLILPAVGQGALGIECRSVDEEILTILRPLEDIDTRACVEAERAFLRTIQGGCQVPVGASTSIFDETLHLRAIVLSPDGQKWNEDSIAGAPAEAELLGRELAEEMIADGAAELFK